MQCEWLGERVAAPDVGRAITNVLHNREDAGWGPNAVFRFPTQCVAPACRGLRAPRGVPLIICRALTLRRLSSPRPRFGRGGTGGIWKGVAKLLPPARMHLGAGNAVKAVDADKKTVTLASGATVAYESLVSTMPLDILLRMLGKNEWADGLTHSSSHIIGVGIRGACPRRAGKGCMRALPHASSAARNAPGPSPHGKKCWLYFPEDNCPFYRCACPVLWPDIGLC